MAERAAAPTDRRYFISVETDFFDHPKTLVIGPALAFAVMASWAYCHKQLTDGFLPEAAAKQILPLKRERDRLVKHGWWEERKTGYLVHDYLKHQPSRQTMRHKSESAKAAAGARWSARAAAQQHAEDEVAEVSPEPGKRTTDHAERNASGNAERNADRNASGNAERNAESMQSKSYSQIQTYPKSDSSRTSRARDEDEPLADDQDADRLRDQARGRGVLRAAGDVAGLVAAEARGRAG